MALEAVVFSQDPLITTYNCCSSSNNNNNFGINYEFSNYYSSKIEDSFKVPFNIGLFDVNSNNNNVYDYSNTSEIILENNWNNHYVPQNYSSPEHNLYLSGEAPPPSTATAETAAGGTRRKRRRRSCKNKEEVEQQRMTHIAVERNRRKQMNEYLAVIRSLMPSSYVQRVCLVVSIFLMLLLLVLFFA